MSAIKPLECVGTVEEARQSLLLAVERHTVDAPQTNAEQRCSDFSSVVVAARSDAERKRLPRSLQRLLDELRSIGVGSAAESYKTVREEHINDFNETHNIPSWLVVRPDDS